MAKQKAEETTEQEIGNLSYEELIALGFDDATAKAMARTSESEAGGTGLPAPQVKFNYDKEEILIDAGVKKGTLISGWQVDRKKLTIKEEGEVLGDEVDMIIVGSVFQNSKFDTQTDKVTILSNIFFSSYDNKKSYDLLSKTRKKITDYKSEGEDKITFNNILSVIINVNGEWKPYIMYLHGTAYFEFNKQLDELGISRANLAHGYKLKVKTRKQATKFQPAWVLDIVDAKVRPVSELVEMKDITSPVVNKFNEWIDKVNAGDTEIPTSESSTSSGANSQDDEEEEDEVNF